MSQSGGTNRTLSYHANWSLTNDGSKRTFEWDAANRLVALNYTGTTNRSEFTYDGLSRVAKVVEKTGTTVKSTRKIVWCGTEMCEFRNATDAVTGRVYAQSEFIGTTGYTFMRDHLGSVRELVKTDGKTLGVRLDYDPYGRQTTITGNVVADFGFTGLYRHAASGLNFAVYRAYDPDLGRWLSRDPIAEAGAFNIFSYVFNNPVNRLDPLGLQSAAATAPPWPTPLPPSVTLPWHYPQPVPGPAPTPGVSPSDAGFWPWPNMYGNFCGPGGHGDPIDCLDSACRDHDECYARCGRSGPSGVKL